MAEYKESIIYPASRAIDRIDGFYLRAGVKGSPSPTTLRDLPDRKDLMNARTVLEIP